MLELSSPSMEHGGAPCEGTIVFGGDDILKSLGTLFEYGVVEFAWVRLAKSAQLSGYGEGDHEVGTREQLGLLFGAPNLLVERATLRAAAVVAAMVGVVLAATS